MARRAALESVWKSLSRSFDVEAVSSPLVKPGSMKVLVHKDEEAELLRRLSEAGVEAVKVLSDDDEKGGDESTKAGDGDSESGKGNRS